jgi:hypothetical protein
MWTLNAARTSSSARLESSSRDVKRFLHWSQMPTIGCVTLTIWSVRLAIFSLSHRQDNITVGQTA